MEADFPFARSIVVVRKESFHKKTGKISNETRYYLSSHHKDHFSPEQWTNLIRGHWGGVEIRNHWRRDAIMGEDKSRTRNPNALANLALIRSAIFAILPNHFPVSPLKLILESFQKKPFDSFHIIKSHE